MTSDQLRTIVFGLVLAVLIVPFGGPYALPALLVIAAIGAFDLWRQAKRREAAAKPEARTEKPPEGS